MLRMSRIEPSSVASAASPASASNCSSGWLALRAADPPVANAGSVIFFHIRRGPDRKTAGCTVMTEDDLTTMIRWLRASRKPHYVLLPWPEYKARVETWGLPQPETIAGLIPASS